MMPGFQFTFNTWVAKDLFYLTGHKNYKHGHIANGHTN